MGEFISSAWCVLETLIHDLCGDQEADRHSMMDPPAFGIVPVATISDRISILSTINSASDLFINPVFE